MVRIMPSSEREDKSLRVLNPLSCNNLRTLSYHKLPRQLLKLSVLKLDGSSFDVNVARKATIAELKQAVEEVFSLSPKNGEGNISWSHVWGHFCLCFEGKKLMNDKVHIQNLGINDGDQLKFVRNMAINYRPVKLRSKNISGAPRQCLTNSSRENAHGVEDRTSTNDIHIDEDQKNFQPYHYEGEEGVPVSEFKLAHFLNGRFSYSKLISSTRKGFVGKICPSRFSLHS